MLKALQGERFGKHPGLAELKIRALVYVPATQREEKLPGKEIQILVPSIEEVDQAFEVMRKALADWMAGL